MGEPLCCCHHWLPYTLPWCAGEEDSEEYDARGTDPDNDELAAQHAIGIGNIAAQLPLPIVCPTHDSLGTTAFADRLAGLIPGDSNFKEDAALPRSAQGTICVTSEGFPCNGWCAL